MSTMPTTLASLAAIALLGGLAACGEDAPDSADEPTSPAPTSEEATEEPSESAPESPEPTREKKEEKAEDVVITIEEFMYSDLAPVAPGTEITIENTDAEAHTVTSDGDFDLTIAPGKSETLTAPEDAGKYPYLCSFHSGMTATLVVE